MTGQPDTSPNVTIRLLQQEELANAERIFRLAFGAFLDVPDPTQFAEDSDHVALRWKSDPTRVFGAEYDGRLVGTNIATNWGSVGYFGPLAVLPELWDKGIGSALMAPVMEQFTAWGNRHTGLFTFPDSPKHIHLYEKFGFFPRFLLPVMSKPVAPPASPAKAWTTYSALTERERAEAIAACRTLTDAVLDGLDLTREIEAVQAQGLGDTVLLIDGSQVNGLAVCHCGEGSEAGKDLCFIKFGAVRPGASAGRHFAMLLSACEEFAGSRGMTSLGAGVNLGCDAAYRQMRQSGFRSDFIGVALHHHNDPGYNRPDRYVLSDWR